MNKLGFYTKNFGAPGVIEAIKTLKPPALLTELDDFSILEQIRNDWSPETFIIGRFYFTHPAQGAMLDSSDPEAEGRKRAEKVLAHNFGFATRLANDGRPIINAWMSLNECVRGPNSFPQIRSRWSAEDEANFAKMERQAAAYDALQVAFLTELRKAGLEAVAFNFAAGNWIKGEDYLKYFPRTLKAYTYLGFHEYGWPDMNPNKSGARSGCGFYRAAMGPIRQKYGDQHRVVMTEAGLARMYMHTTDGVGDVGWLYPGDQVAEDRYKESLRWYNQLMCSDPYVVGACLFQVGPGHDWESFRHTGTDNQGQPLTLMQTLQELADEPVPAPATIVVEPAIEAQPPEPAPDLPAALWGAGRPQIIPLNRQAKFYKIAQERGLGERLTPEYEVLHGGVNYAAQIYEGGLVYAPVGRWDEVQVLPPGRSLSEAEPAYVWDHHITGFHGNRWMYWTQILAPQNIPGLTLQIFVEEALLNNPAMAQDANMLKRDKVYKMPRTAAQSPAPAEQPAFTPAQGDTTPPPVTGKLKPIVIPPPPPPPDFVQTRGNQFVLKGQPLRFVGANIRGLVHYGHDPDELPHTFPEHQAKQLQEAALMNVRLVRVFLAHKKATPQQVEARLRQVLALIKQHFSDIYLLPALTNLYSDVPFYVRGDDKFYTPNLNHAFFEGGYRENYFPFVQHIVTAFKDEPRIFAWEIGNELKAEYGPGRGAPELLVNFMLNTAGTIKRYWDPNHLVTTGMISTRHAWMAGRQDLRRRLYGSPAIDFITIHAYDGNEKPDHEKEDDSDLAAHFNKPFIIEEAGFNRTKYPNRPEKTRQDMANWYSRGASCYMPWGFVATGRDNGDGDNVVGMGTFLPDWRELFELHKQCGALALAHNVNDAAGLGQQIANINFIPRRGLLEPLPWPFLADGFDFPVGKPDGLGYHATASLVDQRYFNERGFWHTGEDWNSLAGGDSDLGAPVFAVANGLVITAQRFPDWGNTVLLEHRLPWGQTVWSQYAHLQERYVQKGDVIRRGEQLGAIGKGDNDQFTAHLHLEIRLRDLPASKWGWTKPQDRDRVLQTYTHPTNFINANRPK